MSSYLPTVTLSGSKSEESTDKLTDRTGANTAITDVFNDVGNISLKLVTMSIALSQDFQSAATPFITSQKDSGASAYNLFKFHTLSHGTSVNHEVKIGIRDIRLGTETSDPENYGTFTVVVRKVKSSFFKKIKFFILAKNITSSFLLL